MTHAEILLIILLMTVVTALPRIFPFWILGNRHIPDSVAYWLGFVPVCLLGAMLLPTLFVANGSLDLSLKNHTLWASGPALLSAYMSRNIFATIMVGMASLCVLRGIA